MADVNVEYVNRVGAVPVATNGFNPGPGDKVFRMASRWGLRGAEDLGQCVRVAHELGREIASGKEAREIYRIGTWYDSADATLEANGMAPNRKAGQKNLPLCAAA